MKNTRKHVVGGVVLAAVGMMISFVGGVFSLGAVSADAGLNTSNDLGLILIIGGAVLVVGAIITVAVVYFAD